MIDAAVACIAEEGYYRASSNRIAQRAGVTWGVIQHHFGTRERLLLEVAREGARRLDEHLASAAIEGATPAARLGSLADVAYSHYARPDFLVEAQIVMNLSRDPSTAHATIEALGDLARHAMPHWQRLVDQVVEPARQPPDLGRALFYALRGAAVGEVLISSMTPSADNPHAGNDRSAERAVLLAALATQLER
jgi:TetR/AcrR family transcriptional regulator, regulator of cefoperazone and chloramphenicol sensitivity